MTACCQCMGERGHEVFHRTLLVVRDGARIIGGDGYSFLWRQR